MKPLLRLQDLDMRIEACRAREGEIPKQKEKFEVHRQRLQAELTEREAVCRNFALEQRECESEIEQKQAQVRKYDQQLFAVKKNEEYQALLHEMDQLKKQVGLKEERVIQIMMALDDAQARLAEDKKRITEELAEIERQCAEIDAEFNEAVRYREELDVQRGPLAAAVDKELLARYTRIRASKKGGPAAVALNDETCTGCHMKVTPQVVNEILAGDKVLSCRHCGRLLYDTSNVQAESGAAES